MSKTPSPRIIYTKRTWLNPETSHFTGSMVCFSGFVKNQGKPAKDYTFVEFSNCHGKVRLHTDENDEGYAKILFARKLQLAAKELLDFAAFLLKDEERKMKKPYAE